MGQDSEKGTFFNEEKQQLITKEKETFIETLADISQRVKESKTFDDFLINSKEKVEPVRIENNV